MMNSGIFGYNALGISITLTCPLKCAHCITNSNPYVDSEMNDKEALKYIKEARQAIDHISITGGEPFLKRQLLEKLVLEAKKLNYLVSVMTSGYWAINQKVTSRILNRLKTLGLDRIGVSLDRYHLPFVKEQNCINIAEAADKLEIPLAVRVIIAKDDNYGKHVEEILSHTKAEVHINYLVRVGRACDLEVKEFQVCSHPPKEICETVTAVDIVPGGDVYACCGPGLYMNKTNPLYLGNAQNENLLDILSRGLNNSYMKVINTRGPYGLFEDLNNNGYGHLIKYRERYTDACQLCLDILNDPDLVSLLESIYSEKDVRRAQNATQFLKLMNDFKAVERAKEKYFLNNREIN